MSVTRHFTPRTPPIACATVHSPSFLSPYSLRSRVVRGRHSSIFVLSFSLRLAISVSMCGGGARSVSDSVRRAVPGRGLPVSGNRPTSRGAGMVRPVGRPAPEPALRERVTAGAERTLAVVRAARSIALWRAGGRNSRHVAHVGTDGTDRQSQDDRLARGALRLGRGAPAPGRRGAGGRRAPARGGPGCRRRSAAGRSGGRVVSAGRPVSIRSRAIRTYSSRTIRS